MILFVLFLLLPVMVQAESVEVDYTEPAGTGFTESCVYSCVQYNTDVCTCVPQAIRVCTDNQTTGTAVAIEVFFNVPIKDGQLPACVNVGVRTKDAEGNESVLVAPTGGSHVFNAP